VKSFERIQERRRREHAFVASVGYRGGGVAGAEKSADEKWVLTGNVHLRLQQRVDGWLDG